MTIAAVWLEDDGLWCVSDTRISRPGNGGGVQVVTDAGAKIYPLSVECRLITFEQQLYHRVSYGIVFAGKTSVATHTLATASAMCRSLQGPTTQDVPSLQDVALLVARILLLYVKDFRAATADLSSPTTIEMMVFGVCPSSRNYEVWKLSDSVSDGIINVVCALQDVGLGLVTAIGSQTERFDIIMAELQAANNVPFRLPRIAVGRMASEGRRDVGGAVSIALCNHFGFQTYWTLQTTEGHPSRLMYGVDLDEIGPVGPTFVSGQGMV